MLQLFQLLYLLYLCASLCVFLYCVWHALGGILISTPPPYGVLGEKVMTKISLIISTRKSKSGKNTLALTPEGEFVLRGETTRLPQTCSLIEVTRTDLEGREFTRVEAIPLPEVQVEMESVIDSMNAWKRLAEGI